MLAGTLTPHHYYLSTACTHSAAKCKNMYVTNVVFVEPQLIFRPTECVFSTEKCHLEDTNRSNFSLT